MLENYKIIGYNKNTGIFKIKINSILDISINVDIEYPDYIPCYDYYFNNNKLYKLEQSNGEGELILNSDKYSKCYQYNYDKYQFDTYGLLNDNAKLYKYLIDEYN